MAVEGTVRLLPFVKRPACAGCPPTALVGLLEIRDQTARDLIELRLVGGRKIVPDRNQACKRPALDAEGRARNRNWHAIHVHRVTLRGRCKGWCLLKRDRHRGLIEECQPAIGIDFDVVICAVTVVIPIWLLSC